ncbi:MAG TPA: TorF family putative porin [Mesorhizobium sp.]|nr:TorF family putative porin [Mesorhizobium sp.]
MRSEVRNVFSRARAWTAAVAGFSMLCLEGSGVRAQTPTQDSPDVVRQVIQEPRPGAINLGGRGWSAPETTRSAPPEKHEAHRLEFSARAGVASDYIYRGTTLSDRKPAVGAGIEATYAWLYAGMTLASVKLPTQPSGEITVSGGVRPTLGPLEFDMGATYFAYPGETPGGPTNGIEYWEATFRGAAPFGESIRVAAGYAYSPNISNTGAWSQYAAAGFGYEVPARLLPQKVGVSFTAAAGYSWFGNQSLALGGFELPAYLNWQAGVTFSHKFLNIDLRYHDTNLSKENCYVFTGDPNATPGGRLNPVTNPDGLMSRWCSATLVAKLWFALN